MVWSEAGTQGVTFFSLAPLLLLFPLLGLLINIAFGGRLQEKQIGWIASGAVGLTFLVSVLQMISLLFHHEGAVIPLADWITIGELNLHWGIQVDTLSVTMMLVVSGVGCLIHIYAIAYMHDDVRLNGDPGRYRRFFVFFNLFILMMMTLVSADNYLMLFVGWEGVGLCSYLLIGFWYDKGKDGIGNALAGKKAFITNRIGDFGFLLAAFTIFGLFRSFEFGVIFPQVKEVAAVLPYGIFFITVFMLLGVAGKSAQIPLYVWLPDAMAGPTPVSALIHAATMVTAGVYLIARSNPFYGVMPQAQSLVSWVGALTALFAATIAVAQFDIKRVLAYSTISQLGFMVAAVGMGAFVAGMFHLVTHAFFKALLFLSSGSVIQGVERGLHEVEHAKGGHTGGHHLDPQDMRNMGGLRQRMPTTFWVYLIGALALAGVVPLAGFWSKDEILLKASFVDGRIYWVLSVAAFFTAFYMARQIIMVFFGEPRSEAAAHASESPKLITVPLMVLAGLSALGGALNLPGLHSFGHWLEHTITYKLEFAGGGELPEFDLQVAGVSTLLALLGLALGWLIYVRIRQDFVKEEAGEYRDPLEVAVQPVFRLLHNKYWVDELYGAVVVRPYQWLAGWLAETADWRFWHDWFHDRVLAGGFKAATALLAVRIDLGIIDGLANGLAQATRWAAGHLRRVQTGYVREYAMSVLLGVVFILGYLIVMLR
jgi:NADH-quinone oxidoreductase subunit L